MCELAGKKLNCLWPFWASATREQEKVLQGEYGAGENSLLPELQVGVLTANRCVPLGQGNSGFFSSLDTTQGAEYSLLRVALCQNVPRMKDTMFMCLVVCDDDPVGICASLGETSP